MGNHSFLGPTDPQLVVSTSLGHRAVPAQAVLAQFEQARKECSDPAGLPAWLPLLNQYGPDILVQRENALDMSRGISEDLAGNIHVQRQG